MRRQALRLCHTLGMSLALFALCAALGACSGWKPFEPPVADEIPEGSGLLSGEDGEFVIFRR